MKTFQLFPWRYPSCRILDAKGTRWDQSRKHTLKTIVEHGLRLASNALVLFRRTRQKTGLQLETSLQIRQQARRNCPMIFVRKASRRIETAAVGLHLQPFFGPRQNMKASGARPARLEARAVCSKRDKTRTVGSLTIVLLA